MVCRPGLKEHGSVCKRPVRRVPPDARGVFVQKSAGGSNFSERGFRPGVSDPYAGAGTDHNTVGVSIQYL